MPDAADPQVLAPALVEWTPRLAVGVEEIDVQHRELFRRINLFLTALHEKRASPELEPLLRYLRQYVREHFAEEQRLMEFSFYAGLGEHMAEHRHFEAEYQVLWDELARGGPTFGLAKRLVALLSEWLTRHIATTDRAFGTFLAKHLGRRSTTPSA